MRPPPETACRARSPRRALGRSVFPAALRARVLRRVELCTLAPEVMGREMERLVREGDNIGSWDGKANFYAADKLFAQAESLRVLALRRRS